MDLTIAFGSSKFVEEQKKMVAFAERKQIVGSKKIYKEKKQNELQYKVLELDKHLSDIKK